MINPKYQTLIEKLIARSKAKEVIWNRTSRENEFKVELKQGSVSTDRWEDRSKEFIDFTIRNQNGDNIGYLQFEKSEEPKEFGVLNDLHELAKSLYYKVDETLDSFFDELDGSKAVGKEGADEDPEDLHDLPF